MKTSTFNQTTNLGVILFFCIFMSNIIMTAQESTECATPQPSNQLSNTTFSGSIDPEFLATFEPVVFNMYF